MPSATKDAALGLLQERVEKRTLYCERAEKATRLMFRQILRAHEAGATYQEIADLCEISKVRVGQILKEERAKRG